MNELGWNVCDMCAPHDSWELHESENVADNEKTKVDVCGVAWCGVYGWRGDGEPVQILNSFRIQLLVWIPAQANSLQGLHSYVSIIRTSRWEGNANRQVQRKGRPRYNPGPGSFRRPKGKLHGRTDDKRTSSIMIKCTAFGHTYRPACQNPARTKKRTTHN